MKIERLAWAGIKISAGSTTAVIDALGDPAPLSSFMGPPRHEVGPVAADATVDAALVTHIHPDHYDPPTLRKALEVEAEVLCPMTMRTQVHADGLKPAILGPGDSCTIGDLTVDAVRAVDGLGAEQVSWIVTAGGTRILHGGDTLWHGYWWQIAEQYGPIDLAFLPINGALVPFPTATGVPASMTPQQAVAAAEALGARVVCPIHYDTFDFPPGYAQYPDAEHAFRESAAERGVTVRVMGQGQLIEIG